MFDVGGRRVLITGGAQGFGKQFARRLLQEKCRVCITDIDQAKGLETKQEFMTQFGITEEFIHFIKFNVSDKSAWDAVWDEAERVMGGKVEIFANNAGINPMHGWEKCLDVMGVSAVRGVFFALDRMSTLKGGNGGRIVNTASVAGISHLPLGHINSAGYNVAKHALVTMTRYFGIVEEDLAKNQGVKCYGLAPWLADTQLEPPRLTRSNIEEMAKSGKPIIRGGVEIRTISDYRKAGVPRALTVEEVGEAFMQSLHIDKNGAVYAVFPDTPLIEFPDNQSEMTIAVGILAMFVGSRLGLKVFKPVHFYSIAGIVVFFLIALVHFFLGFVF